MNSIPPPQRVLVSLPPRGLSDPSGLRSLRPSAATVRPEAEGPAPEIYPEPSERRPRRGAGVAVLATVVAAVLLVTWRSHTETAPSPRVETVVSGRAGLKSTPLGTHERWAGTAVKIALDPSLDAIDPAAKNAVVNAFGAWVSAGASLPSLSFDAPKARGALAEDGVNRMLYGPITIKGHEKDVAATVAYADASTGVIKEVDTIFNSAYRIGVLDVPKPKAASASTKTGSTESDADEDDADLVACQARYDLQNVATHEAGHVFGLGEDVDDHAATMYLRSSPCETHKRVPKTDDVAVMTALYMEPVQDGGAGGCGGGAQVAPTRGRGSPVAIGLLVIAGLAVRRLRSRNLPRCRTSTYARRSLDDSPRLTPDPGDPAAGRRAGARLVDRPR